MVFVPNRGLGIGHWFKGSGFTCYSVQDHFPRGIFEQSITLLKR